MRHRFEHDGDRGGDGEAGLDATLAGREADADAEVRLARAARAERDDVLPPRHEFAAGEIEDALPVQAGQGVDVEALEGLQAWE